MPFEKLQFWLESDEDTVYVYSNGWLPVVSPVPLPTPSTP
jgi:hypothetical protein